MYEQPSLRNLTKRKFGKPPKQQNPYHVDLGRPHTASFDHISNGGLADAVRNINPVEFTLPTGERISLRIRDVHLSKPAAPFGAVGVNGRILPAECRQRAATYTGKLSGTVSWSVNGGEEQYIAKDFGNVPIMLKSNLCHLNGMSPKDLVKNQEHENEWGGYFVVKGYERLVRMLLMTRRNYPVAIKRSSWKQRGAQFTDLGVLIRSVAKDETGTTNVLHYVSDGTVKMMFSHNKAMYYFHLILVLKMLCDYTDHYIYKKLTEGCEDDLYYTDSVQNMLRELHSDGLHNQRDCRDYIGKMFRARLYECAPWKTNEEVAKYMLKNCILIHLDKNEDKFDLLCFMTQKLFAAAQDKCRIEGADAVMMQELLLGGHLYLQYLKTRLQNWLNNFRIVILNKSAKSKFSPNKPNDFASATNFCGTLDAAMEKFISTGNVPSNSGLGLMQDTGLTIIAENINRMRYMSHFKAVHRGSFFQSMRTTEARQLLPDAWGFICPVHTPDGAPCGLLNHLTLDCRVTEAPDAGKVGNVSRVLFEYGMAGSGGIMKAKDRLVVMLDGRIVGYVHKWSAQKLANRLRVLKIDGEVIPDTLEIVLVPKKDGLYQFPGLFLFTGPARMMRPVMNLSVNKIELIGTFEQVYLEVCVTPSEAYENVTTHMELDKSAFMSNLAQLIPMPDCNQSPRNMYQCQMGKQTMGTPCHNWQLQSESKLYRLQTPASPLFRPIHYDRIDLDSFAMGTNAIVAVISYTGYDMEDAMIINKAAEERGFAHGSIYKAHFYELDHAQSYFCRDPSNESLAEFLGSDGLPHIGQKLTAGDPLYCFFSIDESKYIVRKFSEKEDCYVNSVKLCGSFNQNALKTVCIGFRITRNPSVGDKFASRAGQKGICSQKWPTEDLPFTETGLVPDIVFNPHGFPSRMTIAMMIELMAGKSAAVHGLVHDATPFRFNENNTAIDYFGRLLVAGGYNYYGTETLYSGIDGREMTAEIFFGVVHYQRLRHMVSDKWQVRSTGPVDALTHQPVQGRKKGGGVRFGEMERDALISHGTSFLLQDRLLENSDKTTALICTKCGSLLGPMLMVTRMDERPNMREYKQVCKLCGNGDNIREMQIPYIFKFLVTQLASCNINVKLKCSEV